MKSLELDEISIVTGGFYLKTYCYGWYADRAQWGFYRVYTATPDYWVDSCDQCRDALGEDYHCCMGKWEGEFFDQC